VRQIEVFVRPGQHAIPPSPPAVAISAPARPARGHTILVVDNLPVNLELARSILEPSGYKVLTAGGMTEGLALARTVPCDLILSDVCMAEGNGYYFIRAVQADSRLRAIPFVFITSTVLDEKDHAQGLALGASRFLRRPIEPAVFLAEISACLQASETTQS
jgi:two-component system, cell cycle response regulator